MPDSGETAANSADDFSVFLHGLRTRELERLPQGAKVVLSGGAAGTWYVDWFESHYPTPIERHIAVEALAPQPRDLPNHVEWVCSSLGDLSAVETASVDLVFAGEVIEHLWPDDIAGFLVEAHRVLRSGGHIALDSPNRRVTEAIRWLHPEHTVEFTVDEIVELLELAGFDDVHVRGVLLGYDADGHRFLPIEHSDRVSRHARVVSAADRPEDSFVWWAQATRRERRPDHMRLGTRTRELFSRFRRNRFAQVLSSAGRVDELPYDGRVVHAVPGERGALVHGPYVPMPRGVWEAVFELSAPDAPKHAKSEGIGWIDATHGDPASVLGRRELTAGDFPNGSNWSRQALTFETDETTMGVEFRAFSHGRISLAARAFVDVRPATAPAIPQRRPRGRLRAWVLRHRRVKALAKVVRSHLPEQWRDRLHGPR